MWSYRKARILAQNWLDLATSIEVSIIDESTISKPYGWVFFYQSIDYLKTENISDMLAGNAPILVDRINGELRVLGTAHEVEKYLDDYEKTIPSARLISKPEFPPTIT
jgi:Immunity protein 35